IVTLLAAVVIATVIRMFLFEPIRVDGESMTNTLQDGEVVLVTKPEYLKGNINRGDIIICRYPNRNSESSLNIGGSFEVTFTRHTLFVKRLIALPGDILEIREGKVYVNGQYVDETGIDMRSTSSENLGPVLLGEDSYFVMGDNRGNSNDSRRVGPISRDMIVGHVERVILPFGKFMQKVE
ncbi:MAG: signal peptidase I, partial [Clostridia bacterium]|nr:signal peptidase I [Clostridia bacterium]